MCALCNGKGVIYTEPFNGALAIESCTCEISQLNEATYSERWEAWLQYSEMEMQKVEAQNQQQAS
ncbi:hypothetical protein [Bacillus sp. 166amftsu]|uniref:hypothetical protein n=1 Tax=Bacillus sp. 166amftsu TaxID=1761753 RepID=UPI00089C12E0|nr:hypothetical protein [Bacillus sp. 166amftsu]SDY43640.1 hypothetical protein SAMN04488156_101386 [Bacillus sp. 166amftsu]